MSNRSKIIYDIGFNVEKININNLLKDLRKLQEATEIELDIREGEEARKVFADTIDEAKKIEQALIAAYNPKIDSINLVEFNKQIKGLDLQKVGKDFNAMGSQGQQAFRTLTTELLTTNRQIKTTNKFLDDMSKTFFNTIKWSISSSVINTFTGAIQKAWGYAKDLDQSLNNIRIVTGKSNEEMERFAKNANSAAKGLGSATTSYTDAALIYYQQGLAERDVKARTDTTIKVANVTKQSAQQVSEQLTAVWNGYKVNAEEAETYIDKVAAVAATTAADLEELSDGMSKVASMANAMGVDIDQLNGMLATTISVTRQDAAVVGTAYKTIFARMGDLAVGGEDEFGVKLGDVSGKLKQMGIDVLDQTGNLRNMGDVIEEVAEKWDTWTDAQQQAAAGALAGKRQINNLLSLFENWDMYESALTTSQNAEGTLQQQQDIYMDSLEAKLQGIRTSAEGIYDSIFDSESMKDFLDALTFALDRVGDFIDGIGGGGNLLLWLGGIATFVFRDQIGKGLAQISINAHIAQQNSLKATAEQQVAAEVGKAAIEAEDKALQKIVQKKEHLLKIEKYLSEEQQEAANIALRTMAKQANELDNLEQKKKQVNERLSALHITNKKNGETPLQYGTDGSGNASAIEIDRALGSNAAMYKSISKETGSDIDKIANYKDIDTVKEKIIQYKNALNTLKDSGKLTEEELAKVTQGLKKIAPNVKGIKDLDVAKKQATAAAKLYQNAIDGVVQEMEDLQGETKQVEEDTRNLKNTLDKTGQNFDDILEPGDLAKKRQELAQNIGIVMSLTSSFMALGSAVYNTFSDENLSGEEKFKQIASSILSIAPSIIMTFLTMGKAAWASLGPYAAAAGAIALIIGVISLISGAIQKAEQQEQKAFEEAQKAAEDAKNAFNEASQAVDNFNDSISNIDEIKDKMKDLVIGTQEWKKALEENNQEVLNLITEYKELAKYVQRDENGVLSISKKGIEELQNNLSNQKDMSYMSLMVSQNRIEDAQYKVELKETTKNLYSKANKKHRENTGEYLSGYNENLFKADFEETVKKIISGELDLTNIAEIREQFLGISSEDLSDEELITALQNNVDALKDNTVAQRVRDKEIAHTFLNMNSQAYQQNLELQEKFADILANKIEDTATDLANQYYGTMTSSGNNDEDQRIAKAYAVDAGLSTEDITFDDSTDEVVFKDHNGKEVRRSKRAVADYVATKESLEKEYDEKLLNDYANIDKKLKGSNSKIILDGAAFGETANLSNYTKTQLNALINGEVDDSKLTDDEKITIAKANGFAATVEGYDAYINNLKTSASNTLKTENAEEDFRAKYGGGARAVVESAIGDTSRFTIAQEKNLYNAFGKAIDATTVTKPDGTVIKGSADAMANVYSSLMTNEKFANNTEQQDAFATAINTIDWTKESANADFVEELRKAGITIDPLSEEWTAFFDDMAKGIVVTKDMREQFGFTTAAWDDYVESLGLSEGEAYKQLKNAQALKQANEALTKSMGRLQKQLEDLDGEAAATNISKQKEIIDRKKANADVVLGVERNKIATSYGAQFDENGEITNFADIVAGYQGEDVSVVIKALEDYNAALDETKQYQQDLEDLIDLTIQKELDAQAEIGKLYDERIQSLQDTIKLTQTIMDLNKRFGRDEGVTSKNGYSKILTNYGNMIITEKDQIKQYLDDYLKNGDNFTKELTDEAKKEILSSADAILSYVDGFKETLGKQVADGLSEAITSAFGGQNFQYVNEDWDWTKRQNEKWLDDVNSEYEVSKLSREYEKIANSYDGNISAQNKLNSALQTELKALKEKDKLSKADLDRARAKLEVTQAEIALEESRRNATEMQLTRDASGNYSYTFVANDDAVAEAEQKLADAQNALYNLDKDRVMALQDEYLTLWDEFNAKISEAMTIEDAKERNERIDQIKKQYQEAFKDLGIEMDDLAGKVGGDVGKFINPALKKAIEADLFADNGTIQQTINKANDSWATLKEILYPEGGTSLVSTLAGVIDAIGEVELDTTEITTLNGTILKLNEILPGLKTELEILNKDDDTNSNPPSSETHESDPPSTKVPESDPLPTKASILTRNEFNRRNKTSGGITYATYEEYYEAMKAKNPAGFATGGYTGEWGESGKLAVLHEKELVLNAADTENILAAVDLVRSLGSILNSVAEGYAFDVTNIIKSLPEYNNIHSELREKLEQQVTIEANFPNVTDRNEIQEAINNLISLAEQKANEKE